MGGVIEWFVLQDFVNDLLDGHLPAIELQRAGVTSLHAIATDKAFVAVEDMHAVEHFMGVVGARLHTGPTGNTAVGVVPELDTGVPSFRVVAPETSQWATLEEDRRADPRAVMDGKTLYVKDKTGVAHLLVILF
jgi:hypothetical protein